MQHGGRHALKIFCFSVNAVRCAEQAQQAKTQFLAQRNAAGSAAVGSGSAGFVAPEAPCRSLHESWLPSGMPSEGHTGTGDNLQV